MSERPCWRSARVEKSTGCPRSLDTRQLFWEKDLQGDLVVELRVGGLPDLPHAPLPEEGGHVVVPEAGAWTRGHDLLEPRIARFYTRMEGTTAPTARTPRT